MDKTRLEAFSDGVIAIIITIMVLELKIPHGDNFDALTPLIPVLLSLCLKLHLCRYLLEQSSPYASYLSQNHGINTVGQLTSIILAVAVSVCYGLDGRKPLCFVTFSFLALCKIEWV